MKTRMLIEVNDAGDVLEIRKVPFLENHWAGKDGSIWVVIFGENGKLYRYHRQKTRPHYKNGRPQFDYTINGRNLTPMVQKCVCYAWHGPRPERHPTEGRYEVSHLHDNDRSNNCAANLGWETKAQNDRRRWDIAVANGTYVKLEDGTYRRTKLTPLRQGFKYKA